MNDILEGYNRKLKREAKIARKIAFACVLPHNAKLTEKKFNSDFWPIDEVEPDNDTELKERIKKMQEGVKKFNIKQSENRRKKQKK